MDKPPGQDPMVLSHYALRRKLGEGAAGEVWLAHDRALDREVAVKLLRAALATGDSQSQQRIRDLVKEARAAARLDHPNVVTIHEVTASRGRVFVVMEYITGGSLADELGKAGALPWRAATQAIRDAAAGLEAAHSAGVIHRDIKPTNLMRGKRGVVKVVDFGLAKGGGDAAATMTAVGTILGSPAYMSPEQCRGEKADTRSDLYSLICTYYELLTRELPFSGETLTAVAYQHCHAPFPDIGDKAGALPDAARRILQKGSEKEPPRRYQSATELLADLDTLLSTPEISHTYHPGGRERKKLPVKWLAAAAVLTLAVAGGFVVARWHPWRSSGGGAATPTPSDQAVVSPPAMNASPQDLPVATADRTILYDGRDASQWQTRGGGPASAWLHDGYIESTGKDIETKKRFQDFKLHVEFATTESPPGAVGQSRCNSGVFLQGRYEVQILESFGASNFGNQDCGAIWGVEAAKSNMSKKPGEWQIYDIDFRAPRFDGNRKVAPASVTLIWNGVKVLDKVPVQGPTNAGEPESSLPGPIRLQYLHGHVRFRNIWVEPGPAAK